MRISDWSSDVCSSDLQAHGETLETRFDPLADVAVEQLQVAQRHARGVAHGVGERLPGHLFRDDEREIATDGRELRQRPCTRNGAFAQRREIGRASCRERGWQYV